MNTILFLVLFFILSISLIMIFSIWFMNFFIRKYIGEKHYVLEDVINGKIPDKWARKYQKKCFRYRELGKPEKLDKLKNRANKTYIKKLNQLVTYIEKTKLVENEETRAIILTDLENTKNQWRNNVIHEQ